MVDDATPRESNADADDEPARAASDPAAIPQPRPTAWVTGGGALTYARAAATPNAGATADESRAGLDPAPQEEASTDGGLDADAATDSDSESDGDAAAWAAADGLDGAHRALRVQGLAWDGIPQNRRRRVWLELSGARARAGDPAVPPPELR